MRILFQYYSGGGGGLANFILLLQAYLRRFPEDHIIIVCSADSQLNQFSGRSNVTIIPIQNGKFKEFKRLWLGYFGLNMYANKYKADIVWSLNLGHYIKIQLPSVLSLNNAYQVYPKDVIRLHPGGPIRAMLLRFFFKASAKSSNGVIVQTGLMKKYVADLCDQKAMIAVIPKAVENGRDVVPEPLCPALLSQMNQYNTASKKFDGSWLYVATALPHKNHEVLFRAFNLLRRRGKNHRLILTIDESSALQVGGGIVHELIQSGNLIPIGWINKEQLKSLYESCNGCVMPSVLESLSSSHLEAMEWGIPQITCDLPYARDLCGDAAIYVDPHSEEAWADAIERLNEDENLKKRLVDAGRTRMQLFPRTWDECADRIREFFINIATGDGCGRGEV